MNNQRRSDCQSFLGRPFEDTFIIYSKKTRTEQLRLRKLGNIIKLLYLARKCLLLAIATSILVKYNWRHLTVSPFLIFPR